MVDISEVETVTMLPEDGKEKIKVILKISLYQACLVFTILFKVLAHKMELSTRTVQKSQ